MRKIILVLLLSLLLTGCSGNGRNEQNNSTSPEPANESSVKGSEENADNENNVKGNEADDKEEVKLPPDFELEALDGTMIKLSELKGKNVILNFWATWCGFCVIEMPDLQKLQDTYKDEDLLVLAINVGETKETVQKFVEENDLKLTVLLDKDSSVANTYGLRSFPSTLAINKKGETVTGYVGMMTYAQMEQLYGYFEEE